MQPVGVGEDGEQLEGELAEVLRPARDQLVRPDPRLLGQQPGEIEVLGGEAGDPIDLSVSDAAPELGRVDERSEASPPRVEAGSQQASPRSRRRFEPEPIAERARQLAQERRRLLV